MRSTSSGFSLPASAIYMKLEKKKNYHHIWNFSKRSMQLGEKFKFRLMRTFQNSKQNALLEYYKEMLIYWLIQDKLSFTNRKKKLFRGENQT